MNEILQSEHRVELLRQVHRFLFLFEGCGPESPQRLVKVNGREVPANRRALIGLQADVARAVRAEKERLEALLAATVSITPGIQSSSFPPDLPKISQ